MASTLPAFDWESAVGPLSKARQVDHSFRFAIENLTKQREEALRSGGGGVLCMTEMIAEFENARERLMLTLGEAQVEDLGRQAHARAGEIFRQHAESTTQQQSGTSGSGSAEPATPSGPQCAGLLTDGSEAVNTTPAPSTTANPPVQVQDQTMALVSAQATTEVASQVLTLEDAHLALRHSSEGFQESIREAATSRARALGWASDVGGTQAALWIQALSSANDQACRTFARGLAEFMPRYDEAKRHLQMANPEFRYDVVVAWALETRDLWSHLTSYLALTDLDSTTQAALRNSQNLLEQEAQRPQELLEYAREEMWDEEDAVEEEGPRRLMPAPTGGEDLPEYTVLAFATAAVLYMLVNISFLLVVNKNQILNGTESDLATLFFQTIFRGDNEKGARALASLIAVSIFGNIWVLTFTAARVKQEIAKEGILPWSLYIASSYKTPSGLLEKWFSKPELADEQVEQAQTVAFGVHWLTSVILIVVISPIRDPRKSFLVDLYSYIIVLLIGCWTAAGLIKSRLIGQDGTGRNGDAIVHGSRPSTLSSLPLRQLS